MSKRIEAVRIINNILIIYLLSAMMMIYLQLPVGKTTFAWNLTLAVFVLLSEIIQDKVGNLILYLLCHGLGAFVCLFAPYYNEQRTMANVAFGGVMLYSLLFGIRLIFVIVTVVLSIYTRLDGKPRFYPVIVEGFLYAAMYFLCLITRQPGAVIYVIVAEVFWAILCIIYYNSKQTMGTLVIFKKMDFVPYEAINRNNNFMLGTSIAISMVFVILCIVLDYGKEIARALRHGFIAVLTWIFSFFDFETPVEYEDPVSEPISGGGMGQFMPELEEDTSIWHTLWQILFWVVAAVVTVFLVILLVKAIQEFYHLFNASRHGIKERLSRDKVEFLSPLQISQGAAVQKKNRLTLRERLTASGRVRRMFIKYIESRSSYRNETVLPSDTPLEMERRVREDGELAYKLYEKARYSSDQVTAEDVSRMKKLIRP